MGFTPPDPTVRLIFADAEFEGLEVQMEPASMEDFLAVQRWTTGAWRPEECAKPDEQRTVADHHKILNAATREWEAIVDRFASLLIDWNLERKDGSSVPATLEGLRSQTPKTVRTVVGAWTDAVTGVSGPLEKPSPSGEISPVESIPMETLSPSLSTSS